MFQNRLRHILMFGYTLSDGLGVVKSFLFEEGFRARCLAMAVGDEANGVPSNRFNNVCSCYDRVYPGVRDDYHQC
eukprot:3999567-Amphidinium_carterae.4